ncbi:hypothetical protein [Adhaeribacter aquaticus]|uniref:hypothetical protein n=1 Tax=Adhaeribacter aquaticus TaxID=299567 RepID=UPI0003FB3E57|nr:hypothetical protein [Adhaeribacter aquaticus]
MSWVKVNAYLATIPQSDTSDDKDSPKETPKPKGPDVVNADDMEDSELDKLLGVG